MHIPDGFLSTPVWVAAGAVSLPSVAWCARKAQAALDDGRIPLMGVMGAFVFAAQMINFPVGVGTSGHLVGGALLAVTIGPAAAALVMTAILTVQALLFQDGGVLALGANVFNMAIAGVLAGYLPYHYWGHGPRRKAAIFTGGFLSVFTSACLAMAQLVLSGVPIPASIAGLSIGLFVASAAVEGAITVAVASSLERLNHGWMRKREAGGQPQAAFLLVSACLLGSLGALLASSMPDGLEKLAEELGIAARAWNLFETPLTDYEARFIETNWLRKSLAGLAGLGLVYAIFLGLTRGLRGRASRSG
jgi:cobalt/nickel transport system permease protein